MSKQSGVIGKTPWQVARSERAIVRQEDRKARTAQEQLALLDGRPGESRRERARLS